MSSPRANRLRALSHVRPPALLRFRAEVRHGQLVPLERVSLTEGQELTVEVEMTKRAPRPKLSVWELGAGPVHRADAYGV